MTECYQLKPCLECNHAMPQIVQFTDAQFQYFAIRCPECDKGTDGYYTLGAAIHHWETDRKRMLPDDVRESIKKIMKRHGWRDKKREYLPCEFPKKSTKS